MRARPGVFAWAPGLVVGLTSVFVSTAPAAGPSAEWIGPNWVAIVLLFWVARRPAAAPVLVVFLVGAAADVLRGGPVGAELFALLLAAEWLRARSANAPAASFVEEWGRAAVAIMMLEATVWALLASTGAPTAPALDQAVRAGATILAYPVLAELIGRVFGARRDARLLDAFGL